MPKYGFDIKITVNVVDNFDLQTNIINEIERILNLKIGWNNYRIHDVYEIPSNDDSKNKSGG